MVETEIRDGLVTPLFAVPLRVGPLFLLLQVLPSCFDFLFVVDFLVGEFLGQVELDIVRDVLPAAVVNEEVADHDYRVGELLVFGG